MGMWPPDGTGQLAEALQAARNDVAVDGCLKGTGSDAILLAPGSHTVSSELLIGDTGDSGNATTLASAGPGGAVVHNAIVAGSHDGGGSDPDCARSPCKPRAEVQAEAPEEALREAQAQKAPLAAAAGR